MTTTTSHPLEEGLGEGLLRIEYEIEFDDDGNIVISCGQLTVQDATTAATLTTTIKPRLTGELLHWKFETFTESDLGSST